MRIVTYILLVMLQGITLYASAGISARPDTFSEIPVNVPVVLSEEITASWEKSADAVIWGDRLLASLNGEAALNSGEKQNGDDRNAFAAHGMCSRASLEKILSLRKMAVDIITSSSKDISLKRAASVAGVILMKMETFSLTPLTDNERKLAAAAEDISLFYDRFCDTGFSGAGIPEPVFAAAPPCVPFTSSVSVKLKINREKTGFTKPVFQNVSFRVNINDREFADLYRLFLYVKDNSGNRKPFFTSYNISFTPQNSTRSSTQKNHISKPDFKILHHGASS